MQRYLERPRFLFRKPSICHHLVTQGTTNLGNVMTIAAGQYGLMLRAVYVQIVVNGTAAGFFHLAQVEIFLFGYN